MHIIKKTIKNTTYAKNYIDAGLVPFTINVKQKDDGKKELKNIPKFLDITTDNYDDYIDNRMNGMAIRMGQQIKDTTDYVVLIDIDNKDDDNVQNGMTKWKEIIKGKKINTPTQKTGNDGLHYLFRVSEEDFMKLPNAVTQMIIDENRYSIDFKGKNGFMIVEPTNYENKNYKWTTSYDTYIQMMPKWMLKILMCQDKKKSADIIIKNIPDNTILTKNDISEKQFTLDELEQYIYVLDKNRADNYEQWLEVGFCLYNINKDSLYVWKKFSKQSKKYNEKECDEKWKTFKTNKDGLKIGSLLYWLRQDNPDKFTLTRTSIVTQNVLDKHGDKYKNTLKVQNIQKNDEYNYITLDDKYCDIKQEYHEENDMYVEMYPHKFDMKCHNLTCRGKSICEHIKIQVDYEKYVFNQLVQNNYYFNTPSDNDSTDDFRKFDLFDTEHMNELVYKGMNGKPIPFAEIMYEYSKNKYVYVENEEWYMYENHRWNLLKGYNAELRNTVNNELKNIYMKVRDYYIEHDGNTSKTVKIVKQLITNFDGTQLTDDIMKELKYIYLRKNRDFSKKLNTKQYLIGFNNGIYDISTHTFRDGKMDDYVSLSTGYNYVSKHTKNHKKLLKFLEDIQPNKNDHDYLLTYISTAFLGNTLELFTVLTGNGRNGKSKFIQLLERVFGDYYDTIKSQLLTTQMKDGDSPSPALLSLGHKRLVVASETLEGTRLNTGFIKFVTGRDTVKHRYCHRNDMVSFAPNFVILLVCNDIPECDNMDIAFSKRLRCINFPTEFVDRIPEGPNQKHKDDNINMYFDDWKEDFFLLLITYYKRYENDKTLMYPTENVLKWTEQYKENTDVYLCFLNECTTESYTHIKSVVLYEKFKDWFIRNNPRRIIPTHRIFSSGIKKYVTIENVRIDNKITKGIKNLEIKLD